MNQDENEAQRLGEWPGFVNRKHRLRYGPISGSLTVYTSKDHVMERRAINPTPWLQPFGMNHAIEVKGGSRTLYLSGQTSTAADGSTLHPGDLVAQFAAAWANVKDALAGAGMQPSDVVRLNIYTTEIDQFMERAGDIVPIFGADGVQPVSTLLGVSRLFDPAVLIELEATAVA
jgi:enamine deaminase RidA (YjgF/YER057c/UK114 family)